jgi:hypothetical protein
VVYEVGLPGVFNGGDLSILDKLVEVGWVISFYSGFFGFVWLVIGVSFEDFYDRIRGTDKGIEDLWITVIFYGITKMFVLLKNIRLLIFNFVLIDNWFNE